MDAGMFTELITSLGFPIACVIGLAWFAYYMVKTNTERSENSLKSIQEQNQRREDKLYTEIAECREINGKAIETIAIYAEKLDAIQHDVHEIKTDITIIKTKEK